MVSLLMFLILTKLSEIFIRISETGEFKNYHTLEIAVCVSGAVNHTDYNREEDIIEDEKE